MTTEGCTHHWLLGEPTARGTAGRCKRCGAERTYPPAYVEGADYGSVRPGVAASNLDGSPAKRLGAAWRQYADVPKPPRAREWELE